MRGLEQIPWLYDALMWVMEKTGIGAWRRWLAGGARGRVLEVGCGTGRNLPLYPAAARVVGIEPAIAPLLAARRRSAGGVPLVAASAERLPFRASTFDTVISSLVFCSVPDPLRGLAEVRRVLAAGGELRMMEHVRAKPAWQARLQDTIERPWYRLTGGCHINRDTEANVRAAGFLIDQQGRLEKGTLRRFVARSA